MPCAGTWIELSKRAMFQSTSAVHLQGLAARCFKCPYHDQVMNRFDRSGMTPLNFASRQTLAWMVHFEQWLINPWSMLYRAVVLLSRLIGNLMNVVMHVEVNAN